MWKKMELAITSEVKSVECSVAVAHPWVYGLGNETNNGAYLSPVNAVNWLAEKLLVTGWSKDVIVLMITSDTQAGFTSELDKLLSVFPAPELQKVSKIAKSAASLATDKMQIPAKLFQGLPEATVLSVSSNRKAIAAELISNAQRDAALGGNMEQIKEQLSTFSTARNALLKEVSDELGELQKNKASAWVFNSTGNIATTLLEFAKGIPEPSSVLTAAMLLVGDDLSGIRGMIREYESDTGT